ncbi:Predicted 5' DNA nuclease, flap endonuclease-1-like, helix-3-turn-helix (H3TH) domain [Micromonospora citrea]|uniref:Predicted 5' DNA nuclease, flap endonuclease-1-like, helix-3-turn-helix (H3TH) domain n=1 Tax=Micromonospora citrea TaxID=47855 RepID=A0A1C6TVB0_9ACTN|nr:Predicted 5' DNA nuclease, flap endonuclease-1-like, helix-3-turn-helix (H3TH) domain [Micromonospora citrea]
MAWSFGHWLILIVTLLVGLAGGWFWRGRQDAAAGHGAPTVEGDHPVDGMTAVVVDPPPVATTDEARPEVIVDRAPDAVADRVPTTDAPTADTPVTVVAADAERAGDVDPADMALTGDPVPAPDTDRVTTAAPVDTAAEQRSDAEVVLPAAAEVTGPVDRHPAEAPTTAAESTPAVIEPEPVAPVAAVEPESAPAQPEPVAAVEPEPVAAPHQPASVPATATAEPESTGPADEPAVPVAVPAPRSADTTPPARTEPDADAADDFRRIQGVGPKMAAALQEAGIRTYRQLAELDEAALRETIRGAGLRAAPSLATWPQQAKVLAGAPREAAAALPAADV